MEAAPQKYKTKSTLRGVEGIAISWLVVAATILLVERVNTLFYLPAIFVLANRFLALNLYAHEGVHGNISDSSRVNDFLGRYFCAFPTFTSFSRYKTKHLMHHRFLGSIADPDLSLYKDYPETRSSFLVKTLQQTLSGKMIYEFFKYYSDIPDLLRGRAVGRSDLLEFVLFHAAVLAGFAWAGVLTLYFWYWIVPLLVCVPYFRFIGALQHAPLKPADGAHFDSRSVIGPKWMMAMLLPVNINYHAAHHLAPGVPHYRLRELSDELSGQS
jgi:fatty acid desaturase